MEDQEQWAQNVEGYMRRLPKPGSMSAAAPILFSWNSGVRTNQWVSMAHFKTVKNATPSLEWGLQLDPKEGGRAEVLGANDDVGEDNEIRFEIP